jgi:hypothetical protein
MAQFPLVLASLRGGAYARPHVMGCLRKRA